MNKNITLNATSNYINFISKENNQILLAINQNLIDIQSVDLNKIISRHDELTFVESKLTNEKLILKKYYYKAMQFHVNKYYTKELDYIEFTKPIKYANLPQKVKYYNLNELLNMVNNDFNHQISIDKFANEIANYLAVKKEHAQRKLDRCVVTNLKAKLMDKLQELEFDIMHLRSGLVSSKIFYLSFQYIIEHRLRIFQNLIQSKPRSAFRKNLNQQMHLYHIEKIEKAINEVFTDSVA